MIQSFLLHRCCVHAISVTVISHLIYELLGIDMAIGFTRVWLQFNQAAQTFAHVSWVKAFILILLTDNLT